MIGLVMPPGSARGCRASALRSTVGLGRVTMWRLAPADARIRTTTAWSWSALSSPDVRSTCRMGSPVVERPTRRPSRTARPATPGPASKPRVAGKAGGRPPAAAPDGGVGPAAGAAASNLHSVRGNARTAFSAAAPSTFLASNFSIRRTVPGPASGARLQPGTHAAPCHRNERRRRRSSVPARTQPLWPWRSPPCPRLLKRADYIGGPASAINSPRRVEPGVPRSA